MLARRTLAVVLAGACAAGIAWLSRTPTSHAAPEDALLRLSWRTLGIRVEDCRPRTEEELAELAPHMRTPEVCTGGTVDYELRVDLAGQTFVLDTVSPGGARRDRPVYVFRDVPIPPGRHEVRVAFTALVPETYEEADQPLVYAWESEVRADSTQIVLITLDETGTRLVRGAG